jgi:hypothetical protein
MRMNLAVTGIDHEPFVIRIEHELLQQPFPNTPITPAAKAPMGVLPAPV